MRQFRVSYYSSDCHKLNKTETIQGVGSLSTNLSKILNGFILFLKKIKHGVFRFIALIYDFICSHAKMQNRVFFYTIRSDGTLTENIKCVYDAYDGNKVYFAKMLPHSIKYIAKAKWLLLTSKVVVTDDYLKYLRFVRLRKKQSVIQIWHAGGAFKRFGLDAPSRLSKEEEIATHSQYTDVCVTSEYVRRFYAAAFGVDIGIIKAVGSPRTDLLLDTEKQCKSREEIYSKHPFLKNKKIYLYLPTFREDDGVVTGFDPDIDWVRLNDELGEDEVFIISRHPVMKDEFFAGEYFSRVRDLTAEPTSKLLTVADVVVTDYSSIIFDASLLGLPMVFYCPDYDSYERSFYLDYESELPGAVVKKQDGLLSAIRSSLENDNNKEAVEKFCKKEMGACDGHSTERVIEIIKKHMSL